MSESAIWINLLSNDQNIKVYRKELNSITGSVLGSLFLSQVIYWWVKSGRKEFYKFNEPCPSHSKYKEGDSWCEELGFTRNELEKARKNICLKVTNKIKTDEGIQAKQVIHYWKTRENLTYYYLNEDVLEEHLKKLYSESEKVKEIPLIDLNKQFLEELHGTDSEVNELAEYWTKKKFNLLELHELVNLKEIPSNFILKNLHSLKRLDIKAKGLKIYSINYIKESIESSFIRPHKLKEVQQKLEGKLIDYLDNDTIDEICECLIDSKTDINNIEKLLDTSKNIEKISKVLCAQKNTYLQKGYPITYKSIERSLHT